MLFEYYSAKDYPEQLRLVKFFDVENDLRLTFLTNHMTLDAIIKKELKLKYSLYTILQILSVTIFDKTPILQALTQTMIDDQNTPNDKQLTMFNL